MCMFKKSFVVHIYIDAFRLQISCVKSHRYLFAHKRLILKLIPAYQMQKIRLYIYNIKPKHKRYNMLKES